MNFDWVLSRKLIGHQLFHISFNGDLEGIWTPGTQAGSDTPGEAEDSSWAYPEPPMKAISVSPTVADCFVGVFPNVARFFEKDRLPHINFFVYQPRFIGTERVVLPVTLTEDKLVWDAHITQEHRILDKVEMERVGEIEVLNTNKCRTRMTHPFNDVKNAEESVGPSGIIIKWL